MRRARSVSYMLNLRVGGKAVGERLLTARVVAERLGLSPATVLLWIREGKLPAFRLPGGAIRIREDELEQWLQARATMPLHSSAPNGVELHHAKSH